MTQTTPTGTNDRRRAFTLIESIAMMAALLVMTLLLLGQLKKAGIIDKSTGPDSKHDKPLPTDSLTPLERP